MESMKLSNIMKSYPDQYVIAYAIHRNSYRAVELANVVDVFNTKREAFAFQAALAEVGIKTFIVPTFENTEGALQITLFDNKYVAEPLLTPSETAKMYRQYWNLDE